MKLLSKRARWLLALCIAIDLAMLVLFWTPSLLGFAFSGLMGRFQSLVSSVASPMLVPLLIVLFVIFTIREPSDS